MRQPRKIQTQAARELLVKIRSGLGEPRDQSSNPGPDSYMCFCVLIYLLSWHLFPFLIMKKGTHTLIMELCKDWRCGQLCSLVTLLLTPTECGI